MVNKLSLETSLSLSLITDNRELAFESQFNFAIDETLLLTERELRVRINESVLSFAFGLRELTNDKVEIFGL